MFIAFVMIATAILTISMFPGADKVIEESIGLLSFAFLFLAIGILLFGFAYLMRSDLIWAAIPGVMGLVCWGIAFKMIRESWETLRLLWIAIPQ